MKLSELWLREWVNITKYGKEFLDQITMAGLEVKGVTPVASKFHGIVVGQIIECTQHPNSKIIKITKVHIGKKRFLKILCDAPNCRQGLKVAVATSETILANDFKTKMVQLPGEVSEGILCSYAELGIYDEKIDIIELPIDAPVNANISSYLKLNDNSIEITIPANRPDCLSIIGIGRDMAAMNKTELSIPDIIPVIATIDDIVPIQVKAIEACPRYLGRIVKGINIDVLTPLWMKEKLRRCGIQCINIVIDIANYIQIELGQPVHIFDKDRIEAGIIIRMAEEGEMLTIVDGRKVQLNNDTVVIADHNKILAIGGILIGKDSSINQNTKNIFLECAFFDPFFIVGRAQRYGLQTTDASHRYEHGVDPEIQYRAMERTTRFLIDICGGEAGPLVDMTNERTLPKHYPIILYRKKIDRLIGYHIDDAQVSSILRRLGCNVNKQNGYWEVVAPSWRFDIKIEEDLIEEVVRIYGYNNIPKKPIQTTLIMGRHCEGDLPIKRVKALLNDKGYQEVITYSFVDFQIQQLIHPGEKSLILQNPISRTMSSMRLSLWPGLLGIVTHNQHRQERRVRIFETGLRFIPDSQANLGVRQDMILAGAICGKIYQEHWGLTKNNVDFYDIKGDVESILQLTGKLSHAEFRQESIPSLHPGQSATIYLKGEKLGYIGAVHPKIEQKLNLNGHIFLFEMEWEKITHCAIPHAKYISRFPANRRDIAIVVNENIPAADILATCKEMILNQIVDVNLFDVYQGEGIKKGFKSLAISLILQDTRRTLEDKEIAATVTKCVEKLKERFQASLRD